jgi:hypothetical protein
MFGQADLPFRSADCSLKMYLTAGGVATAVFQLVFDLDICDRFHARHEKEFNSYAVSME